MATKAPRGDWDITAEEIARRAAEIRDEWSPEELARRDNRRPVEAMRVSRGKIWNGEEI